MRSLVAPSFGDPSVYDVVDFPTPIITSPTQVLIKVAAASINGHDIVMASGKTKMVQSLPLPYPIGLDFAGTILELGAEVTAFAKGDEVYGFTAKGGAASTHLLLDTRHRDAAFAKIPKGLTMVEAASLPAVAITAATALKRADEYFKSLSSSSETSGLQGKTVFIPGALSGVGSIALQIAKHQYNCRTLTAVSTSKLPLIEKSLGEGVVDQAIDYTVQTDIVTAIGKGTVDFVLDTTGLAADYLPLLRRSGLCLSIARLPPGSALKNEDPDAPAQSRVACIGQNVMDGLDAAFRAWAKTRWGVVYVYQKTEPRSEDVEEVSGLVGKGWVRPVVGRTVGLEDEEGVREGCMQMFKGKGGVGKFVITAE
ncbi:hypothetical protein LTR09_006403 [Extremus antarcticus]|uniref:Enoyl reductase (ER) domain-containing protein n=1 Tax=Extremus antarcticus TaxID=702011 RepID=A0AAJ0DLA6_9PEZI|nr:hypothetical protein LTR09_006403 [Extremus antarcticus]